MEASACSGCITLSPVHEAKEPRSPQKSVDGATTEEEEKKGSTKLDGGKNTKLKKRTLFREEGDEEETIKVVTVKAVGDTQDRVGS